MSQTAEVSEEYAAKFNAGDFGFVCGMMHDLGKYSKKFQEKLQGKVSSVDHATAGARKLSGSMVKISENF